MSFEQNNKRLNIKHKIIKFYFQKILASIFLKTKETQPNKFIKMKDKTVILEEKKIQKTEQRNKNHPFKING